MPIVPGLLVIAYMHRMVKWEHFPVSSRDNVNQNNIMPEIDDREVDRPIEINW